ncbi:glucoamylase family protein [Thermophagus sp. OGC60D27]|uniref:glucoamylase family protein n=1 Tax=Thermophagus sp. OGC60D27 TaxID=3458415 RepID=UPI0040377A2C
MRNVLFWLLLVSMILVSCDTNDPDPEPEKLSVSYVYVGEHALSVGGENNNIDIDEPIEIKFDQSVSLESARENISLGTEAGAEIELSYSSFDQNKLFKIEHPTLDENSVYTLSIKHGLKGENGEVFEGLDYTFSTLTSPLQLESITIGGEEVNSALSITDVNLNPVIELNFNVDLAPEDLAGYISLTSGNEVVDITLNRTEENRITVLVAQDLDDYTKYLFTISPKLEEQMGRPFDGLDLTFYTGPASTPKFPAISDEELLTKIQQQTFRYFWDFAHPVSGMARERNTSDETVTTGGTGFGIMAIVVGMERGFITREEGVERLNTIVNFLAAADRFHGAWPHWLNGTTGDALPFSTYDDGGDLVETSFLVAGLLSARQYLDASDTSEKALIDEINDLWDAVEWDWYTRDGQNVLYWHWSSNHGWAMNMPIKGYNEALITYVLAASSTTHTVPTDAYHQGWADNGEMANGNQYYGYTLPLGQQYGGPLFFAHYSFLGLDPRNLSDQYADYWEQNVNHTLINRQHCIENPNHFVGYGPDCWGLTASDNHEGYSAHSPTNDLGVITPTAAISSLPYTPVESLQAIRFFYYQLGDRLWGDYGFYDAFNITEGWVADSYLAIDQGPIVVMIENYRSGLIWELLMSCPEIQEGLTKLGFNY